MPVADAAETGGEPELRSDAGVAPAGDAWEGPDGELAGSDKLEDVLGTWALPEWAACAATVGGCGSASSAFKKASISSCSA